MLDRIRPFLALSEDALQAQLDEFKALAEGKLVESDRFLTAVVAEDDSETAKRLSDLGTDVAEEKKVTEKEGFSLWGAISTGFSAAKSAIVKGTIAVKSVVVKGATAAKSLLVKGSTAVMPVGYALGSVDESYTTMYQFMGSPEIRTPGFYCDFEAGEYTDERIHPSVHYRQEYWRSLGKKEHELYHPTSLKDWKRGERDGYGREFKKRKGFEWVLKGKKGEKDRYLWEFEIADMPDQTSIEKRLIEISWAKEVHKKVKQEWVTL